MTDKSENRAKGDKAEGITADYLNSIGYKIIKKNFHFGKVGEVDIIAEYSNTLVFIEVRSRYNEKNPDPIFSITRRKQNSIVKTAQGFLFINKIENKDCRFDFITIEMWESPPVINHIENAFTA